MDRHCTVEKIMNYDRYQRLTEQKYNNKKVSQFFMRDQANKVILPYIEKIKNKKILEVGVGYGYYTKIFLENKNNVIGLDANPQLGKHIGIEIIHGYADAIKEKIEEKFEYIVSFFMTEYLPPAEIKKFIEQSIELLDENGIFLTTVISNRGLGGVYIWLARMKGVKKYNYSNKQIKKIIDSKKGVKVKVIPLNTILRIPFAILLEVKKI